MFEDNDFRITDVRFNFNYLRETTGIYNKRTHEFLGANGVVYLVHEDWSVSQIQSIEPKGGPVLS